MWVRLCGVVDLTGRDSDWTVTRYPLLLLANYNCSSFLSYRTCTLWHLATAIEALYSTLILIFEP
jgi:hypothetical protein